MTFTVNPRATAVHASYRMHNYYRTVGGGHHANTPPHALRMLSMISHRMRCSWREETRVENQKHMRKRNFD
jgi:hypothetical protein